MFQRELTVQTTRRGGFEITREVADLVRSSEVESGLCNLFICHTSASLMISENADPAVLRDLETFMADLVPDGDPRFAHTAEGPDDMPAHVRSILTQTELNVPVRDARLALGTWQGIFVWEHRTRPHRRRIVVTIQR
ncbi:MAG TPA: secondary thiamine-phosphate synthase enzyme YjbQ [Gammaproteobacteria bacterium]